MPDSGPPPSSLLVEELFAAEDDRFVEAIRALNVPGKLIGLVERWRRDRGAWPRRQIKSYFDQPLNAPGHEVVVKRLFKQLEENADDEGVAWCMAAFDRLVRRQRRRRWRYDYAARQGFEVEALHSPDDRTRIEKPAETATHTYRRGGQERSYDYVAVPAVRNRKNHRLFNYPTRHHLRRRAWRYFRRLGFMHPERHVPGLVPGLMQYRDDDFAKGENILDNWALMHACYGKHPALRFTECTTHLADGHTLAELSPAPYFPELWRETEAFDPLLTLLVDARSSLVRHWALQLIERDHPQLIASLTPQQLLPLLDHADPRVQAFAADAFGKLDNLGHLSVDTWLTLLGGSNPETLGLLCDAFTKNVVPDRLTDDQVLDLAGAAPVPVARLGFNLVQTRHDKTPLPTAQLSRLAEVQCVALADEATRWALEQVQPHDLNHTSAFFDSPHRPARVAAMDWLQPSPDSTAAWNDPALWARLIETPHDDLRLGVIQKLEQRETLPGHQHR